MKHLAEILLEEGVVSEQQMLAALDAQASSGEPLGWVLVELGFITEEQLVRSLAMQIGLEFVDLDDYPVDRAAVVTLPGSMCRRHTVLPVGFGANEELRLAMADPGNVLALDDVRTATGRHVQPLVGTRDAIERAIDRFVRADDEIDMDRSEADAIASGPWLCPNNGTVNGDVYALGGLENDTINTNGSVTGNMYIDGNAIFASQNVKIDGDLIVNGDFQRSTGTGIEIGGRLIVNGSLRLNDSGPIMRGSVDVRNDFTPTGGGNHYSTTMGNSFPAGLWVQGNVGLPPGAWNETQFHNSFGGRDTYGGPANPDAAFKKFPVITRDHAMWDGMIEVTWDTIRENYGPANGACEISNKGWPVIINEPTILDFMHCSTLTFRDAEFVLNADLVIFAPHMAKTGYLHTTSGIAPGETVKRSLYLVVPAASSDQTCPQSSTDLPDRPGMTFSAPGCNQNDVSGNPDSINTAVLFYSMGSFKLASGVPESSPIAGQIYACSVRVSSSVIMYFSKVGEEGDLTDTLYDLRLQSLRTSTDL